MGGCGSGRPKTRERTLVEDCDYLDIGPISKYGWSLYPVFGEIESIEGKDLFCIYYNNYWFGKKLDLIEYIEIETTFPNFGGERYWFKCLGCGKRVKKLYSPPSESHFRCRKCYDLMYKSQESNVWDGWLRKTAKMHGLTPKQYEKVYFS
jgi:hypothetical protein